jgi:hypothetical protein
LHHHALTHVFCTCGLLLQMVCQATTAPDVRIRVAAFSCLHEIAANYYSKLPAYMAEIFNMSVKAINGDEEEVALQVGLRSRVGQRQHTPGMALPTRQQLLHLRCAAAALHHLCACMRTTCQQQTAWLVGQRRQHRSNCWHQLTGLLCAAILVVC